MNLSCKRLLILPAALLCLTGAKVYKWTDENGQVHFGTQPPPAKMQQAEATRYGSSGEKSAEAADVIQNKWYAKENGGVIELSVSSYGYQWAVYKDQQKPVYSPGKWELFPGKLTLNEKTGATKNFSLKEVYEYRMVLVEYESERRYTFNRLKDSRYDLSEKEELASGTWAEVSPTDDSYVIARVKFEDGQFTRYYTDHYDKNITAHPNPNHVKAQGNWKIEGDTLVLEYAGAFKDLLAKSTETERWNIELLDPRNFRLRQDGTGEIMHFKRKREK
ncbi:MAG: DUF4124 domain-containing protein [Hahellaceae bacterium]|nr:DUF4124 domain-containing protein [Hahellaceae bacterium]MCP5212686.1 DUF4124 domain-containing protein [Hahellaceae bacterium]